MLHLDEQIVRDLLIKNFKKLVGVSCKRIEVIRDAKEISFEAKCDLFRDLIKELDYEAMRDLREILLSYSDKTQIQVSLTKPER